jgi:hypothetical protein
MEWYTIVLILGLVAVILLLVYVAIKLWVAKKVADLGIPLISDAFKFVEKQDIPLLSLKNKSSVRHISGSEFIDAKHKFSMLSPSEKKILTTALRKSPGDGKRTYVQNRNDNELKKLRGAAKKVYGPDGTGDADLSEELKQIDTLIYTEQARRIHNK